MSPTLGTKVNPLTISGLKEAAGREGPCITLLIPDRHPGAPEAPRAVLVRGMTKTVAEELAAQKLDAVSLLQPIEEFGASLEGEEGGPGIALFRSPGYFRALRVAGLSEAKASIGRHFHFATVCSAASMPQEFHILALNRKNLHLYRFAHGRCEPVPLPANVPPNMEAALLFDRPEHRLESRAATGSSTGAKHAVQFGSSAEADNLHEHLHDFFQIVDRELKAALPGTPLLLAGVHEEVAAYRRAARNHHLLAPEIQGNIDFLPPAQIATRASEAALAHYRRAGEAVLEKFREMPDRKRTRTSPRAVLSAAMAGRVHQLCVAEKAEFLGSVKGEHGAEREDFVNAAIAATLRAGGEVYMLPSGSMPKNSPVVAILRF